MQHRGFQCGLELHSGASGKARCVDAFGEPQPHQEHFSRAIRWLQRGFLDGAVTMVLHPFGPRLGRAVPARGEDVIPAKAGIQGDADWPWGAGFPLARE